MRVLSALNIEGCQRDRVILGACWRLLRPLREQLVHSGVYVA